jgi:cell pole-organizing protein PopZ
MNQPAKAQEPSMEEILASIRRIISDDDAPKPAAAAPPPPASAPRPAAMPPRTPTPPSPPQQSRAAAPPPPQPPKMAQKDIDAMMAAQQPEEREDILELTEQMAAPPEAEEAPAFQTIDGQSDVFFTDPAPEPPPRPVAEPRPQPAPVGIVDRSLMSAGTSAAVDSAFNALAQTVLVQNARTLEDLVREMLRPLLKSWLDDNLPGMVERIVKAEIERVSRGR